MKKKQVHDSPILHIVLGIFLVIQTAIYFSAVFDTESTIPFVIFAFINLYLCFFHFAYSVRIRKKNMIQNKQQKPLSNKGEETNYKAPDEDIDSNDLNSLSSESNNYINEVKTENEEIKNSIGKELNEQLIPNASDINDFFKKHH